MKNLILKKLEDGGNIVRVVSPHNEIGEKFCIDVVLKLSQINQRMSNGIPQNILLLLDGPLNGKRENEISWKTLYPNRDMPNNIFIASEDEFMDKRDNCLYYNFELFENYVTQNNIKIIYINDLTFYLYHRCGFQEFLIHNDMLMIYYSQNDWKNIELNDDFIYIDKYEESKYSISYRKIKRELISKVVTEDFLTI